MNKSILHHNNSQIHVFLTLKVNLNSHMLSDGTAKQFVEVKYKKQCNDFNFRQQVGTGL